MSDSTVTNAEILNNVAFDEDGYMVDASAWNKEIAEAIAAQLGLELTDRHWIVINFAREQYQATGEAPTLRKITKQSGVDTKELYQLFPGGAAKVVAKIAGLKKPTGCI
ncbi:MAG: TusE/DsrC/DsvC family sulfur relay protein [Anaerolineae bacterium]